MLNQRKVIYGCFVSKKYDFIPKTNVIEDALNRPTELVFLYIFILQIRRATTAMQDKRRLFKPTSEFPSFNIPLKLLGIFTKQIGLVRWNSPGRKNRCALQKHTEHVY